MKKTVAVTLALSLLLCGAAGFAAIKINALRDKVEITQHTEYGDKTAADGIEMHMKTQIGRRMFWETAYTAGAEEAPRTAYEYHGEDVPMEYDEVEYISIQDRISGDIAAYYDFTEDLTGLAKELKTLAEETPADAEGTRTVSLKEYYDQYEVNIDISLNGMHTTLTEGPVWEAFNRFLRVPVKDTDYIVFHMNKLREDAFGIRTQSVDAEGAFCSLTSAGLVAPLFNRCFFTLRIWNEDENSSETRKDYGSIPGGYGVYTFPYNAGLSVEEAASGFLAGDIENVLPLAEDAEVSFMDLNGDGTKLMVYTAEPDGFYLTVLDIETLRQTQKLRIGDDDAYNVRTDPDAAVILLPDALAVITETNGVFTPEFTVPTLSIALHGNTEMLYETDVDLAFRNGKLAWAAPCGYDRFGLMIIDKTGLVYYGVYENGAIAGHEGPGFNPLDALAKDPIRIRWEK